MNLTQTIKKLTFTSDSQKPKTKYVKRRGKSQNYNTAHDNLLGALIDLNEETQKGNQKLTSFLENKKNETVKLDQLFNYNKRIRMGNKLKIKVNKNVKVVPQKLPEILSPKQQNIVLEQMKASKEEDFFDEMFSTVSKV